MSWILIANSTIVALGLTLALQHLILWWQQKKVWSNLLFFVTATATVGLAVAEVAMMRAETVVAYNAAVRWGHVPAFIILMALIGFVRLYLGAGRLWLAASVCVVRTLAVILNFLCPPNLNFLETVRLRRLWFLGETVSIAEGGARPLMLIGQLGLVLLILFVLDATVVAWRRGARRQALLVGGSIVFWSLAATLQTILAFWGIVRMPFLVTPFYLAIAVTMSFKLMEDVLRAIKLDRALRESQQQIAFAAEAAHVGLWVWDIRTDTIWMTTQGRALFGFEADERLDLARFLSSVHPEDRPLVEQAVRRAIQPVGKSAGRFEQEYRRLLPDGRTQWLAGRGRVERGEDNGPLRMHGVLLDISLRMEAELAAQRHRNEVAHLSRANMLSALAGSFAHELNQPLTAILSNAQAAQRLLAQTEPDPKPDLAEMRDILTDIVSDDRRAREIIGRLRNLLEKGEIEREPVDLNEVVRESLKLLRTELLNRKVSVQTTLADPLPPVLGDRVQIQQVLINLIVNGCEAMHDSPIEKRALRISTRLVMERVEACVVDCGPGVPAAQRETIFQPFFTTKTGSMGLGLSVCRTILVAHKGSLGVEPADDGGAAFTFSIPLIQNG